jgi:hypothetical protein
MRQGHETKAIAGNVDAASRDSAGFAGFDEIAEAAACPPVAYPLVIGIGPETVRVAADSTDSVAAATTDNDQKKGKPVWMLRGFFYFWAWGNQGMGSMRKRAPAT